MMFILLQKTPTFSNPSAAKIKTTPVFSISTMPGIE
jgi:hypothetical protein